jgi:hypothetical protein
MEESPVTLNDQEIQEWQAEKDQSISLRFYSRAKECLGRRFILNLGRIRNLLLVREDSLNLGERKKFTE